MKPLIYSFRPFGYGDLKEAAAALIHDAGGVRKAADLSRVGKSQVSAYENPYQEEVHMPVDVVLQLEKASGSRAITSHLAFQHHSVLVQLPSDHSRDSWFVAAGRAAKEHGEALAAIGAALEDGTITREEAMLGLKEVDETLTATAALRQKLLAVLDSQQNEAA